MLIITLDASDVIDTLSSMIDEQLRTFPSEMGQEVTNWQTVDMRRRYPNTSVSENVVETDIWPTSRMASGRDQKKVMRARKAVVNRRPTVRAKGSSLRPILRSELFDKLVERMDRLMSEKLSWQ